MHTGLGRFIRDVGLSFASLAVSALVHFVLRVFLGRYLGEGGLGLYTLAFTVYSVGMLMGAFGIDTALTKYVAQFKDDRPRTGTLLTNGLLASLSIGCVMALVLYATGPAIASGFFHKPELAPLLRIVSMALPFIAMEKAVLGYWNGLREMRLYAAINIAQNVLIVGLTVVLALAGYGLEGAAWGLVLPVVAVGLASVLLVRGSLVRPALSSAAAAARLLLAFGAFVVLANGIGFLQTYTDSVLIGRFMESEDVGVYAAAVTLSQAILLPAQALQMITGPTMSTLWGEGSRTGIQKVMNDTLKLTAALIIPVALAVILAAPDLLDFVFGPEYVRSTGALRILMMGSGVLAIWASVSSALSSTAYVRVIFILSSLSWVANVVLNLVLIPVLGITGSATATATAMFLGVLLQVYFTQRLVGIRLEWRWFLGMTLVTAALGGGCYALAWLISPYACLAIFLVVFAAVYVRFFLGKEQLALVRQLVSRGRGAGAP